MYRLQRDESNDPNHDAQIHTIVAVFSTLSLIALILRLMSRKLKRVVYHYDDYLAIAAWVILHYL